MSTAILAKSARRLAASVLVIGAALAAGTIAIAQIPTQQVNQQPTPVTQSTPSATLSKQPPDIPVDQVIQKFGARELEFKKERDNYTYTQTFVIQTIDYDNRPDGEYRMTSDILFTPEGKRYEKVISAPTPTLQRITLSQQDLDDLEHVQPFVLTSDELPKYDVTYAGREPLDELKTSFRDSKHFVKISKGTIGSRPTRAPMMSCTSAPALCTSA